MARPKKVQTENFVTVSVRLPESLHKEIQERAANEDRSMNWMISALLRQALDALKKENKPEA